MPDLNRLGGVLAQADAILRSNASADGLARCEGILREAINEFPDSVDALAMLGATLSRQRRWADAQQPYQRLVELRPADPGPRVFLAEMVRNLGRFAEAIDHLHEARRLTLDASGTPLPPEQRQGQVLLIDAMLAQICLLDGRPVPAAEGFARLAEAQPREINHLRGLGLAHAMLGEHDAAWAVMERVLAAVPADHRASAGRANLSTYADRPIEHTRDAHAHYTAIIARAVVNMPRPAHRFTAGRAESSPRPLRVGMLSPDVRRHVVGHYLLPVLQHWRDHHAGEVEVFLYHTGHLDDHVTEAYRAASAGVRLVASLHNAQTLAQTIAADNVHILMDLAGYTQDTRLPVFALRPAPVQIAWLAYPNTTGLPEMDARIVDSISDPPGLPSVGPERLLRLDPLHVCHRADLPGFAPPPPPPSPPPCTLRDDGNVTLGCFNAPMKLGDTTLKLWGEALATLPGSTLLVKHQGLKQADTRARFAARFARLCPTIDPARVDIQPPSPESLWADYARVDATLDSFPYNGTTTTIESLLAGVPVVTLAGDRTASRMGAALLAAVGLSDLVARSPDQYAAVVARLCADRARLATLRSELPARVVGGPIGDVPGLSDRLLRTLRAEWLRWATGTPATV